MNSKVSVIITTYNQENYIENTVSSLIKQDYKNIEIIIVDDGSNDNSKFIIQQLVNKHKNIKCLMRNSTGGYSVSRNDGYGLISDDSEYILFHRCGDISYSNKIEYLVNFLENNIEYCAVGSFVNYIDENGSIIDIKTINEESFKNLRVELEYRRIFNTQHLFNNIILSSTIIKRNILDKFMPIRKYIHGDYDLWNRIIVSGYKIKNIDLVFGNNILSNRYSTFKIDSYEYCENEIIQIQEEYKRFYLINKSNNPKYKIGVIIIGTNKYFDFVPNLIESVRKHFLNGFDVKIYLFTNRSNEICNEDDLCVIPINHIAWPGMTLLRYDIMLKNRDLFNDRDYLYYIDADMIIVNDIDDEILDDIVVVKHPVYYRLNSSFLEYERNKESMAYMSEEEGNTYYYGCFQGGKKDHYLNMIKVLNDYIEKDVSKKIIAKWFDESYLNKYCYYNKPSLELDPSYASCGLDRDTVDYINRYFIKIVDVKKDNDSIRNNESENDFFESKKQKDIKDSICLAPWMELSLSPIGNYCNCCMSTIIYGKIENTSASDIWNNDIVKNTRKAFMNGKIPSGCEICFEMDRKGILSFRKNLSNGQMHNYDNFINNTDDDGFLHINKLKLIEIKYGNLCNCRCRMCGHYCSTCWYNDAIKLKSEDKDNKFNLHILPTKKTINIESVEDLDYKIGSFISKDYTESIVFLGGEPLINSCNNDVLQYLLNKDMRNTSINFFTNLSVVTDDFIDILKEFKNVYFNISIDGIGDKHDYIRGHKGIFEKVLNNFNKLSKYKFVLSINPCFSLYNCYHLPDLLEYILENKMVCNDNILITPVVDKDFLRASILPDFFKEKCLKKFEMVEKRFGQIHRIGEVCRNQLLNTTDFNNDLLCTFYDFTFKLDKIRNENILDVFPEHLEIIKYLNINY